MVLPDDLKQRKKISLKEIGEQTKTNKSSEAMAIYTKNKAAYEKRVKEEEERLAKTDVSNLSNAELAELDEELEELRKEAELLETELLETEKKEYQEKANEKAMEIKEAKEAANPVEVNPLKQYGIFPDIADGYGKDPFYRGELSKTFFKWYLKKADAKHLSYLDVERLPETLRELAEKKIGKQEALENKIESIKGDKRHNATIIDLKNDEDVAMYELLLHIFDGEPKESAIIQLDNMIRETMVIDCVTLHPALITIINKFIDHSKIRTLIKELKTDIANKMKQAGVMLVEIPKTPEERLTELYYKSKQEGLTTTEFDECRVLLEMQKIETLYDLQEAIEKRNLIESEKTWDLDNPELDIIEISDKDDECYNEKETINPKDIKARIQIFKDLRALYDFMGSKMELKEGADITDEDIKFVENIKRKVKR